MASSFHPWRRSTTMTKQSICPNLALACLLTVLLGTAHAQTAKRTAPAVAPAEPGAVCLVADFKAIGLQTHDPQERSTKVAEWLKRNAAACSPAQAIMISSNRSAWLGTADSPMLMAALEGIIETNQKNAPAVPAKPAAAAAAVAPVPPVTNPAVTNATTTAKPATATPAAANRPAGAVPVVVPVAVPVAVPGAQAVRAPG